MMKENIEVTKEIVDARENILNRETLDNAFRIISNGEYQSFYESTALLQDWHKQQNDEGQSLMLLLLGYYKIAETPEQKFNKKFVYFAKSENKFDKGFVQGMLWVAQTFNLNTISHLNADGE